MPHDLRTNLDQFLPQRRQRPVPHGWGQHRLPQKVAQIVGQHEQVQPHLPENHEGVLREIDLDELRFTLRDTAQPLEIRCVFEESILEQAKAALDKRVRVFGTRKVALTKKASPILQVTRLEVIEEEKSK